MGRNINQRPADALSPIFGFDEQAIQLRLMVTQKEDSEACNLSILLSDENLVPLDHRDRQFDCVRLGLQLLIIFP